MRTAVFICVCLMQVPLSFRAACYSRWRSCGDRTVPNRSTGALFSLEAEAFKECREQQSVPMRQRSDMVKSE